jgi:hypothetical protein
MTRKDYQLIAGVLNQFSTHGGHAEMVMIMAEFLAEDNPRFDRARFLTACGVN